MIFYYRLRERNYGEAENVQDFLKRIYNFLDGIKINYSHKKALIVCDMEITKAIECYTSIQEDEFR